MCTFPGPSLPAQLIINLNQGRPSSPPHLSVLSARRLGVGLAFVLGRFPSSVPGEAGDGLLLRGQFRETNLSPDLSRCSQPGLDSFVTGQLVTPGAGLSAEPSSPACPSVARFGDAGEDPSFQTVSDIKRPDRDLTWLRKLP